MRIYLDSSALTKLHIEEPGSAETARVIFRATEIGVSVLGLPEVISALRRRRRENKLTDDEYRGAKEKFLDDVEETQVLALTPSIIDQSILLLEHNTLRASDAIHVASALIWRSALFVSGDVRQIDAAKKAGLKTHKV